MKLISWNMDYWRRKTAAAQAAAWAFLREQRPSYALLQEAVPLNVAKSHCVFREDGIEGKGRWGSAVVSFGGPISAVSEARSPFGKGKLARGFMKTMPGCVAVADPGKGPLLISIYGAFDEGYAVTTVHSILSDLTPLIDSSWRRGVVVAGDLNVSSQWLGSHRPRHRNALDRFETLGLVSCLGHERPAGSRLEACPCEDPECRHVRTLRYPRSRVPWQTDYVFVSRPLQRRVTKCEVIDRGDPDPWQFSDHCPVLLELQG